jgi:hypothetical protein
MTMDLIPALIGLVLVLTYLLVLIWAVAALPFTVIVIAVIGVLLYDFVLTARRGNGA